MNIEEINVTLAFQSKNYPFNFAKCVVADVGHSDNILTVTCPDLQTDMNNMAAEIDRLTAELKEREGEVGRIRKTYDSQMDILRKRVESLLLDKEFLTSNVNHAESLAATRLVDQEAIERHVSKRVAREILLIMECSESYEDAVSEIRNQYGVE